MDRTYPVVVPNDHRYDVLLLDFGGVCLLNPVELHHRAETALGLAEKTFTWLGPLEPGTDPLWQEMTDGQGLTEREYWATRAGDVGRAAGIDLDLGAYMTMLYDPPTPEIIRSAAVRVVEEAKTAGIGVSVLTNDMRAFHGETWERQVDFLRLVDHLVDCSDTNVLKPDPAAYRRAAEMIGIAADRMLFVDDQPRNVEGAIAVGMDAVWFDIADADSAWDRIAEQIGVGHR